MKLSFSLPFKKGWRIAELGGGASPLKSEGLTIVNVDKRQLSTVDIVQDLEEDFSHIGQFDGIYAHYLAEHISWRKIKQFFKSCYNILKTGGVAMFVTPNTLEQCQVIVERSEWGLQESCILYGNQDYSTNVHKTAFSPQLITDLLTEAGFSKIVVHDHPNASAYDMITVAHKNEVNVKPLCERYEREYFEDNTDGYIGFWDFPSHQHVVDAVIQMNPKSVLDVGGARGYIVKHLQAHGIPATCMDFSHHCWHTRATKDFVFQDATKAPWPFEDNEFDLVVSTSFMEHIPEEHVDTVIGEIARVGRRSYHEVTFEITEHDIDTTHREGTMKPCEWWVERFNTVAPGHQAHIRTIAEAEEREGTPVKIPVFNQLVKYNMGSHINMFYYGWINSDVQDLAEFARATGRQFHQIDVRQPLPMKDNSVDIIVAHHLIEHLTREEGRTFVAECHRVLKPGGYIRLSAPDTRKIAETYARGDLDDWFDVSIEIEKASDDTEAFYNLLTSGHLTGYDENSLLVLLKDGGFNAYVSEFDCSKSEVIRKETVDSLPSLSCYAEGHCVKVDDSSIQTVIDDAMLEYLRGG